MPQMDKKTKLENIERMYNEGVDMANQMITFLKDTIASNTDYVDMSRADQKKYIKTEKPEFVTFMQLHPIVSEYLIHEKVFSKRAFKRYLRAVYGTEKSQEDQQFIAKDPKNVYFFKNKQYAMYYKYLVQESNNHLNLEQVNQMYNHMVDELNRDTQKMLDRYEEAKRQVDAEESELTQQKKEEFLKYLRQKHSKTT